MYWKMIRSLRHQHQHVIPCCLIHITPSALQLSAWYWRRLLILDPNSPRLDDTRRLSPRTLIVSVLSGFKSLSREALFTIFLSLDFENLGKFRLFSCHTKRAWKPTCLQSYPSLCLWRSSMRSYAVLLQSCSWITTRPWNQIDASTAKSMGHRPFLLPLFVRVGFRCLDDKLARHVFPPSRSFLWLIPKSSTYLPSHQFIICAQNEIPQDFVNLSAGTSFAYSQSYSEWALRDRAGITACRMLGSSDAEEK